MAALEDRVWQDGIVAAPNPAVASITSPFSGIRNQPSASWPRARPASSVAQGPTELTAPLTGACASTLCTQGDTSGRPGRRSAPFVSTGVAQGYTDVSAAPAFPNLTL